MTRSFTAALVGLVGDPRGRAVRAATATANAGTAQVRSVPLRGGAPGGALAKSLRRRLADGRGPFMFSGNHRPSSKRGRRRTRRRDTRVFKVAENEFETVAKRNRRHRLRSRRVQRAQRGREARCHRSCTLLTADQVKAVFGVDIAAGSPVSKSSCMWKSTGTKVQMMTVSLQPPSTSWEHMKVFAHRSHQTPEWCR